MTGTTEAHIYYNDDDDDKMDREINMELKIKKQCCQVHTCETFAWLFIHKELCSKLTKHLNKSNNKMF